MVRHQGAEAAQPGRPGKWLETPEGWAKANLIYEKTVRLPRRGSLREALLLTIWLRREEIRALEVKVTAIGMMRKENSKAVETAFTEYFEAVFPFQKSLKSEKSKDLIARMEREIKKGPLRIMPISTNPLRDKAKMMQIGDKTHRELIQKARSRRQR